MGEDNSVKTPASAPPPETRTQWAVVLVATFAGATAAMQVGKAASALPLIRAEFGADVSFLATYISLISIVAATVGFGFGVVTGRIGTRRSASLGLALIAAASLASTAARGPELLIGMRLIEALGFALCSTSLPAVIRMGAGTRQQSLALGIWATWMPAGIALAMALSWLTLDTVGWRGLFALTAAGPVLALAAIWVFVPRPHRVSAHLTFERSLILRRDVWLTTLVFVVFSAAYLVYFGFLPTILVDRMGLELSQASLVTLLAVLCLLPSNVLSGVALDRGLAPAALLVVSFLFMLVAPVVMMAPQVPPVLRFASMAVFAAAAGVPPSVVWASVSRLGRRAEDAPILSGLFYQGAGLGQFCGPLLAGFAFDSVQDWSAAVWVIGGLCALGVVFSAALAAGRRPAPAMPKNEGAAPR